MAPQPPPNAFDQLLDQAAQKLFSVQNIRAQNRFTQVPIDIQPDSNDKANAGEYHPFSNRILINTNYTDPFWWHNQRTMSHEAIHSLLGNSGFIPYITNRPKTPEASQLNDKVLNMFSKAKMRIPAGEAPVFIGMGDISRFTPNLTEEDAQKWMDNFTEGLSSKTRIMLNRMINNYHKSKKTATPDESTRIE